MMIEILIQDLSYFSQTPDNVELWKQYHPCNLLSGSFLAEQSKYGHRRLQALHNKVTWTYRLQRCDNHPTQ